jgi:uncharacterized protein (DUF983 family)
MNCLCPHCTRLIVQDRNVEGLNYCTHCGKLFLMPPPGKLPPWILGVLVVLTANWQMVCRL